MNSVKSGIISLLLLTLSEDADEEEAKEMQTETFISCTID